jgi:hypothetical protein
MKFISLLASVCLAFSVDLEEPKRNFYFQTSEGDAVSGPLVPCENFKGKFDMESVVLSPYPIVSGEDLHVTATGNLLEKVVKGAKVVISVKFGKLTLFSMNVDLCEEAAKEGISCPMNVGQTVLKAGEFVPGIAPAGHYNLEFRVKNANGGDLACVAGKVEIIKKQKP